MDTLRLRLNHKRRGSRPPSISGPIPLTTITSAPDATKAQGPVNLPSDTTSILSSSPLLMRRTQSARDAGTASKLSPPPPFIMPDVTVGPAANYRHSFPPVAACTAFSSHPVGNNPSPRTATFAHVNRPASSSSPPLSATTSLASPASSRPLSMLTTATTVASTELADPRTLRTPSRGSSIFFRRRSKRQSTASAGGSDDKSRTDAVVVAPLAVADLPWTANGMAAINPRDSAATDLATISTLVDIACCGLAVPAAFAAAPAAAATVMGVGGGPTAATATAADDGRRLSFLPTTTSVGCGCAACAERAVRMSDEGRRRSASGSSAGAAGVPRQGGPGAAAARKVAAADGKAPQTNDRSDTGANLKTKMAEHYHRLLQRIRPLAAVVRAGRRVKVA